MTRSIVKLSAGAAALLVAAALVFGVTIFSATDPGEHVKRIGSGRIRVTGDTGEAINMPSCGQSVDAHGDASADLVGMVSCYVDAQRTHDLLVLARCTFLRVGHPVVLGPQDVRFSRAAREGRPSVRFVGNDTDESGEDILIRYGNGQRQTLGAYRGNPSSDSSWRLFLGTYE